MSHYRRVFWQAAGYALKRGQIDAALGMGFVAHHLIRFTHEALRGEQNASFYSTHEREPHRVAVAMHSHTNVARNRERQLSDVD